MDTKKDIATRKDIETLLYDFYEKVKRDEVIGKIFTEIIPLDWDHHIPVITDFWETILLDNPVYKKNAMQVHYDINKIYPLKPKHFSAWLHLFNGSVDHLFKGEKAELAKKRAAGIAAVMQLKMAEQQH